MFSFTRPIRGSGHVYDIYPQACLDVQSRFCLKAAPLSSGRIVPRVKIAKGNSINATCET